MENKKKNKKIILLFFILTKVLISLSLTVILPVIVFFLFISIKPQEISVINEYIKAKAIKNNYIDDFSFDSGKLFLDKYFNIGYKVQNLKINKSNTNFFKEILNEYKIEPDQILFFEDSLASMKCAKSLGFNVVAVMDKKWEKQKEEIIASSDDQIEDFSQFILNR